ncbi:MAG: hypothetical protein JXR78_11960, partial [Victivallales bacterium]|nr:hypothetical protein [Victivallales bacterium]
AQCHYQSINYGECTNLLGMIPETPERLLLLAQVKVKKEDFQSALVILNKILAYKNLPDQQHRDTLKLSISCAMKVNSHMVEKLIYLYLVKYPNTPESAEYAKNLLRIYDEGKTGDAKYYKLAEWFIINTKGNIDVIPMVLSCAEKIVNISTKEKLLRCLLDTPDFSAAELNALLKHIPTLKLKQEFLNRYQKTFVNTPELCELYYLSAEIAMELDNYADALRLVEILLQQPEVFRYKECKMLKIRAHTMLRQEEEGRRNCQELLLSQLTNQEKRQIVLELASSWERSGDNRKAIATAWTAVPLDGKSQNSDDAIVLSKLLQLIVRNAQIIDSQIDIDDAKELLEYF